jgi:hypothetical protein
MTLKWSLGFTLWGPDELGADLALWLDADDTDTIVQISSTDSIKGNK